MSSIPDHPVKPTPAATVIVVRRVADGHEPQVLLVQRNQSLNFYGNAWVFPGGKIDPQDVGATVDTRARAAAVREAFEETGLKLEQGALHDFAHWTTPEIRPRRFSAWFYATELQHNQEVRVDGSEIVDSIWATPSEILKKRELGNLQLSPPTFVSLVHLSAVRPDAQDAITVHLPEYFEYVPRIVAAENRVYSLYQGDAGYEEREAKNEGALHRLAMFPNRWEYIRNGC